MPGLWSRVLEDIRGQVRTDAYNTWFRPLVCAALDSDGLRLQVPEDFYLSWFQDNFETLLRETLERHLGLQPELRYERRASGASPGLPEVFVPQSARDAGLETAYTFDSFVVGDSNKFAQAAAQGVAHKPGEAYNPLFIYGNVGLGKTHLLHAIGNEILRAHDDRRVRYVTCETFVNDVVQMLATGRQADSFRALYRDSCDVLLVDDIQFLGGKGKSQIEFFNVFNALYGTRKQIVLSCDRYPRDIPNLEQRLQSRFQWGLVVDIEQPDLETRVAILQRKAAKKGMELPSEVAMLIATHIKANVRELEGSLTRLHAYLELTGAPLTVEMARLALGTLLAEGNQRVTVERVMQTVANYYNVSPKDLMGPSRKRAVATPRHVAMYFCKKLTDASYPALGERFGKRDHSTVVAAVQKVERLLRDPRSDLATDVNRLTEVFEQ